MSFPSVMASRCRTGRRSAPSCGSGEQNGTATWFVCKGWAKWGCGSNCPPLRSGAKPWRLRPPRCAKIPVRLQRACTWPARRKQYDRQDCFEAEGRQAAEHYLNCFADLAVDQCHLHSRQPGIVRLAFLVRRGRWAAFQQRAELLPDRTADESRTLLGPWPPYSFV